MSSLDKARDTQLRNIEAKTGQTIDQMRTLLKGSGLVKHGELRSFAMEKLGLGYGDANTLVHVALATRPASMMNFGQTRHGGGRRGHARAERDGPHPGLDPGEA